jgi:hypothetical protein
LGVTGLPRIFDLPPAVAVKRADQFARSVHPVLQAACARCHNDRHTGTFQLIEVKHRRDLTSDVLRANLDATLGLVDPDNPAKSDLLSSALVPHGSAQNKKPIFRGSNDIRFQILSAWVQSLRTPGSRGEADRGRFGPASSSTSSEPPGSAFAIDRGRVTLSAPAAPLRDPASVPASLPDLTPGNALPSIRYVPGRDKVDERRPFAPNGQLAVEEGPPAANEFPLPPMLGGPPPKLTGAPDPGAAIPMPGARDPAAGGQTLPELPPPPPANAGVGTRPKKPLKIDPDLLQKALMNRNATR